MDCLAAKLRPGNVHSAEGRDELLLREIECQQAEAKRPAIQNAKNRVPTLQLQSAGIIPLRAEAGKRIVSAGRTNRSDPSN
jgi:hypothetical protein